MRLQRCRRPPARRLGVAGCEAWGAGAGGDIYRGAETRAAGPALSHMLIGYLRRIFLDVTVHAKPMPSVRSAAEFPTDKH